MRRLLIRSKRRMLIASDYLERPHDEVDRAQPIAIDRARSFHVARWSLETGTSVPVAPMWTRATGRELVAIDRARFGKVSCGHGLRSQCIWHPSSQCLYPGPLLCDLLCHCHGATYNSYIDPLAHSFQHYLSLLLQTHLSIIILFVSFLGLSVLRISLLHTQCWPYQCSVYSPSL